MIKNEKSYTVYHINESLNNKKSIMRIPKRKPPTVTTALNDPNITKKKFDELTQELINLKKYKQPKAQEEVERLALMGDFSENAAYQIAKGKLRGINGRIFELETYLKKINIINTEEQNDIVCIGSTVSLKVNNEKIITYTILGSSETDPAHGIISHNSALGSALLGKKLNETIQLNIGEKTFFYTIISIT